MERPKYNKSAYIRMMQIPPHINEVEKRNKELKKWADYHKQQKAKFNSLIQRNKDKFYHRDGTIKPDSTN